MPEREQRARPQGLGGRFSLAVDEERLDRFMACGPAERVVRAQQWQITMGEMMAWARRCPKEVPLVDGEFFFIAESLADHELDESSARPSRAARMRRPGASLSEPRPAGPAPGVGRQAGVGR